MSADLIGDDACREAFNKARQQRFSVHGLDVVCEPDIFRSGYAAGRDSEIAKRDARIMGLESQYQRDVWGLNNEGDPIGGEPAGGYANDNARLRAELAAIKAQDTVGEVVGWYRLDRPYEMTSYPSVCATWHKLGAPVAPLYAAPAAPAADATVRQATDGGRNQSYEGLFDGETEEQRASRLATHRSKGVV